VVHVFEYYSVILFLLWFKCMEFSVIVSEGMSNGSVGIGSCWLHAYLIVG
jgi:hypothetical protein